MPVHLGLLARDALARPPSDVFIHRRPHDLGADGLARPLDTRVSEAVYGIKNGLAEGVGYKWPRRAIAYVDDEAALSDVDALKVHARPRVVSDAAEVGV